MIAGTAFLVLLASVGFPAAKRSLHDIHRALSRTTSQTIPPEVLLGIQTIRDRIPRGSTILYFRDFDDIGQAWQLGLVDRSLFPDYIVVPVYCRTSQAGRTCFCSPTRQQLAAGETSALESRQRQQPARFAIAAVPLPGGFKFAWQVKLPTFDGKPLILGELGS